MYCMGVDPVELTVMLFVAIGRTCIIAWVNFFGYREYKPHSPKLVRH